MAVSVINDVAGNTICFTLKDKQKEVIQAFVELRRKCSVPTGYGKSLMYL